MTADPTPATGADQGGALTDDDEGLRFCCCHGHLDGLTLGEMAALGAPCPTAAHLAARLADEREHIAQACEREGRRMAQAGEPNPSVALTFARIAREGGQR